MRTSAHQNVKEPQKLGLHSRVPTEPNDYRCEEGTTFPS